MLSGRELQAPASCCPQFISLRPRCDAERSIGEEVWAVSGDANMLDPTLYEELRSGDRYERGEVKRPWTAGSKASTTSCSSSRARAAELLIHASRAETMPEHRGLQQQQHRLQQLQQQQQLQQRPLPKLSRPLSGATLRPALSAPTLASRAPASRPQSPERLLWQASRPPSRQRATASSGYGRRLGTPATPSSVHMHGGELPEQLTRSGVGVGVGVRVGVGVGVGVRVRVRVRVRRAPPHPAPTRVVAEQWPHEVLPHPPADSVAELAPPPAMRKEVFASAASRSLQVDGCDQWLRGLQAERARFASNAAFSMYSW